MTGGELPGRLADAEHQFKFAIGVNPQDAEAQNNLGVLYTQQGKDRKESPDILPLPGANVLQAEKIRALHHTTHDH